MKFQKNILKIPKEKKFKIFLDSIDNNKNNRFINKNNNRYDNLSNNFLSPLKTVSAFFSQNLKSQNKLSKTSKKNKYLM